MGRSKKVNYIEKEKDRTMKRASNTERRKCNFLVGKKELLIICSVKIIWVYKIINIF